MRTEVLVIGGGAAGVEVAAALRRHAPDREVTVVTSAAELLYRPWLVYLPAGKLDGQALRIPMAQVAACTASPSSRTRVRTVRLAEHQAVLASRQEVEYACVVIAAGAPADRGCIPGSAEHALFPCEQDDAVRLASAVTTGLRGPLTIVVTGERIGPPLEFAGWSARRMRETAGDGSRDGGPPGLVRVVDDAGAFDRQFGPAGANRIAAVLTNLGIEVIRGAEVSVSEVTRDAVVPTDGRKLASSLVAIGTPLRGPDLDLPTELRDSRGFVIADEALRVKGHAEAFVAGDALELPGVSLPKIWGMARILADCVARNIAALPAAAPPIPLNLRRIRRLSGMSMPDIGGRTVFIRNRHPLVGGAWPLRVRYRLDRNYLRQFRPASQVPTPGRL